MEATKWPAKLSKRICTWPTASLQTAHRQDASWSLAKPKENQEIMLYLRHSRPVSSEYGMIASFQKLNTRTHNRPPQRAQHTLFLMKNQAAVWLQLSLTSAFTIGFSAVLCCVIRLPVPSPHGLFKRPRETAQGSPLLSYVQNTLGTRILYFQHAAALLLSLLFLLPLLPPPPLPPCLPPPLPPSFLSLY
jgi:hypothetical protein